MNEHGQHDSSENEILPDHTVSLRKALAFCRELLLTARPIELSDKLEAAQAAARSLPQRRQDALKEFWTNNPSIEIIEDASELSPLEFRKQFHHLNRPCLVRGFESHFASALSKWKENGKVNREWFCEHLGNGTLVPVRCQPPNTESDLDEQGRAVECETKEMSLSAWIEMLDSSSPNSSLYLKDWHLVSWLEKHKPDQLPLYRVPDLFQHDLLNSFLTRFTSGDYRFVYWGPKDSTTSKHSDVLNSFSWSFNVEGIKEWTFYSPMSDETIVLTQQAGECIFVPATWTHQVVNVEETLSINHNWITTANIDLTWDCMQQEMKAVEKELNEWGIQDWEANESMLRGCVGLDVSCFFLMILVRMSEILILETGDWESHFDLVRLNDILEQLAEDAELHLLERLTATLASNKIGKEAVTIATKAMQMSGVSTR